MNEYIISTISEAPSDWMEQISSSQGVITITSDIRLLLIKCSEGTVEKFKKKFKYLKIEFVCPHYTDEEKEEK